MGQERIRALSGCLLIGRLQERGLVDGGYKINMPKVVADLDQMGGPLDRDTSIKEAFGLMRACGHVAQGDSVLDLLGMAYDGTLGVPRTVSGIGEADGQGIHTEGETE